MTIPTLYTWVPTELVKTHVADGVLHPSGPLDLVWMTTSRSVLGGRPFSLGDMTRVTIDDPRPVRRWLDVQGDYPMLEWMGLELAPGARPENWFVSEVPLAVTIG